MKTLPLPCQPREALPFRPGLAARLPAEQARLAKILLPIDFSAVSRKAFDYAIPVAEKFGACVDLLHVIEPSPYTMNMAFGASDPCFPIESMMQQLAQLGEELLCPEIRGQSLIHVGIPFEVITDTARDLKADLIILTTHGHTGFRHIFMGSTAERVVRHAPCPVLVVRPCEHGCF